MSTRREDWETSQSKAFKHLNEQKAFWARLDDDNIVRAACVEKGTAIEIDEDVSRLRDHPGAVIRVFANKLTIGAPLPPEALTVSRFASGASQVGGGKVATAVRSQEALASGCNTTPHSPNERSASRRIRQSSKPLLNKLEKDWLAVLQSKHPAVRIHTQAIRFKLGNGIWYKPDMVGLVTCMTAWEVKGPYAFRGGFENLKVAASQYPEIRFFLVWRENGQWKEQLVLS